MIHRVVAIFLSGLLVILGTKRAVAQETSDGASGTVLARFGDARALAVDPRGRLYVADAGRDVVAVLDQTGTRRMVVGGSGTRAGEFDVPSDVDPTNGQLILVADTYNGRVQRFSEEGQYLESLPVGRTERFGSSTWDVEEGRTGDSVRGDGRPVAVAQDDEGTLFVLDERTRRLLMGNDLGRSGQIREVGDDRLQEPVALAVGGAQRVYVADAGHGTVFVYDTFGTFRRRVPLPPLPTVRALVVHRGQLWIVCAEQVLVWARGEGVVAEHPVDLTDPLVDVALQKDDVYLLTPKRLLRRARW